MIDTPFLTDIDPQAAVKGSRDPLGVQTIWSRLGRHVVGNVTTVSTSMRDFTTTTLGYYFVERISEAGGKDGDLAGFLRWEQLAAHARFRVNNDDRLRGIERVRKSKNDGDRIRICADSTGQILSNQRTYGLWGLYTGPARASGLVDGDPTRLASTGRRLVDGVYLPAFTAAGFRNADAVVSRLARSKIDLDSAGADRAFLKAVGTVLDPKLRKPELDVFREHLLHGRAPDRTGGRQSALATALDDTLDDKNWSLSAARVGHLAKACRQLGPPGEAAAARLERIRLAESVLAPSTALFGLLLGSDGQAVADIQKIVSRQWGSGVGTIDPPAVAELEVELRDSTGDPDTGKRWVKVANALASGEYALALELLMEQNAFVMKARASAGPWVDLSGGRLRVRYRDENLGDLPERKELPALWRHSYFIDALRTIALELRQ